MNYYFWRIFADRFIIKIIIACSISCRSASSFSFMSLAWLYIFDKFVSKKGVIKDIIKKINIDTNSLICGSQIVSFHKANSFLCNSRAFLNSSRSCVLSSPTSVSYLFTSNLKYCYYLLGIILIYVVLTFVKSPEKLGYPFLYQK